MKIWWKKEVSSCRFVATLQQPDISICTISQHAAHVLLILWCLYKRMPPSSSCFRLLYTILNTFCLINRDISLCQRAIQCSSFSYIYSRSSTFVRCSFLVLFILFHVQTWHEYVCCFCKLFREIWMKIKSTIFSLVAGAMVKPIYMFWSFKVTKMNNAHENNKSEWSFSTSSRAKVKLII